MVAAKTESPSIKIIKVGTLCLEPSDLPGPFTLKCKYTLGIGGGSTVTLIQSDKTVLVDTGFEFEGIESESNRDRNAQRLLNALQTFSIAPKDIDVVFITHWHQDHYGNLHLFPQAQHIVSAPLYERLAKKIFTGVRDGEEIASGVKVVFTPGHTSDHASILVDCRIEGMKARVAIAGDAIISYSYFAAGKIWNHNADFYDRKTALDSIKRLTDVADIVIPGHGTPFFVTPVRK